MYRVARVAIIGAAASVLLATGSAMADSNTTVSPPTDNNAPMTILNAQQLAQDTRAQASTPPSAPSQSIHKLTANAMKLCDRRQQEINILIQRIDSRSKNQLALFTTIAARVETFYASKSKPVTGYLKLETAVALAETKAQSEQSGLSLNFVCDANNPKATAQSFIGIVRVEVSDLQSYRIAVKNLIIAIANANGVKIKTNPYAN